VSAPRALDDVLAAIAAAMRDTGLRWYLFGAQAATLWGRPRLTADVDLTAKIPPDRQDDFLEAMKRHAFHLRFDDPEFVSRTRVFPFVHQGTGIPVDIVLAGAGLEDEFLDRAVDVRIEGIVVPVISPEDLIITKVLAGRPKDIEDVRGVLRERADTLDTSRIRDTLHLLEEALAQSDLVVVFEKELAKLRGERECDDST
jgi:predicted nucleotidyltransferase